MDMPRLNDAARCARLAMVVDEIANLKQEDTPMRIGAAEFKMCGGIPKTNATTFSLYRQLVYATRDIECFVRRECLPSSKAVAKANSIYAFYSDIDYDDGISNDLKSQDVFKILRLLVILQQCRNLITSSMSNKVAASVVADHKLPYAKYLLCGGKNKRKIHKHDDKTGEFSFPRQVKLCVNDLRHFITRGRFPPPVVMTKAVKLLNKDDAFAKNNDDEEVDDLDGGPTYPVENGHSFSMADVDFF